MKAARYALTRVKHRNALSRCRYYGGQWRGSYLSIGVKNGSGKQTEMEVWSTVLLAGCFLAIGSERTELENKTASERRGKYILLKELGKGGFATVRLALDTDTDQLLAAKIFNPKLCTAESIQDEIEMLKYLGEHKNIVGMHDVIEDEDETIMMLDLVEGGELFDYIVDMGSMTELDASRFLRDICTGLAYIHSREVCHRDIKPENMLLSKMSSDAMIKIADFGLSRRHQQGESHIEEHPMGTTAYWAPEIIKREPQDFGVDMWAFGVLSYIALTGVHPFDPNGDRSDAEIIKYIAEGTYDEENDWYKELSSDAKRFLSHLLDRDTNTRLTAKQALQHPWLKGQTPSTLPLPSGLPQRIQAYKRLQQLRANVLAVVMGVQHLKLGRKLTSNKQDTEVAPDTETASKVNMYMFRQAFGLFDRDGSGGIDRNELDGVMKALGQHLTSDQLDAIMREGDADGNGKITFDEFVTLMNQRLFQRGELTEDDVQSAFHLFDVNHDGFITTQELEHTLHLLGQQAVRKEEVLQMMKSADCDGDGKIDYNEFRFLMRQGRVALLDNSNGKA